MVLQVAAGAEEVAALAQVLHGHTAVVAVVGSAVETVRALRGAGAPAAAQAVGAMHTDVAQGLAGPSLVEGEGGLRQPVGQSTGNSQLRGAWMLPGLGGKGPAQCRKGPAVSASAAATVAAEVLVERPWSRALSSP